jgi:hypothetical protein
MDDTLLKDILRYIVPKTKSRVKPKNLDKEQEEHSYLEALVRKLQKQDKKQIKRKKKISEKFNLEEKIKLEKDNTSKEKNVHYSLDIDKEEDNEAFKDYSVSIKYHEDDDEEKIEIEIKPKDGDEEKHYAFSLIRQKSPEEAKGHSIDIEYNGSYKKEHVTINYNIPLLNYEEKKEINKQDFSNLASNKWVDIFPESQMGGVLGFTYLGDNYQALRADMLYSPLGKMVDLHEAIHTPDEHETRVLTSWMMDVKKPVYKK